MPVSLIAQLPQGGGFVAVLILALLLGRELKMLVMRVVFAAYGYPKERRDRRLEKETARHSAYDLLSRYLRGRQAQGDRGTQPPGDKAVPTLPSPRMSKEMEGANSYDDTE
jgi:hypothetical protein